MPEGVRLFHRFDGPANAPVLLLSNSLGTALERWDPQMPAFAERFRVLRYDMRGHGRSAVPPGPYSIADLGRDVLALLDANGIDRVRFCGLSMGGMTGMWLGCNAPERLEKPRVFNNPPQARVPPPLDIPHLPLAKQRHKGGAARGNEPRVTPRVPPREA